MTYQNPAPEPSPDSLPFWQAANRGEFLIKQCEECDQAHWYPRPCCPFCASAKTVWRQASGRGKIYSYSYLRRMAEPYVIAYVTLEEGPTMMTNIVDCDPEALSIGQPVTLVFKPSQDGEQAVPLFRPLEP
ncbi:Zn-ribbon domain-containing OB-fold protein [Neorhizobium alkalisoli]|uniref:OB-fold protein n=1 Tax=Neorhizobium alkalisoli TaxID=528178 RepID=A0A561QAM6_9HYPH|nr:OB-fold domain-containing protein [Neorhizobium alkalisoli]TWF47418.1 hypothetical protein FHW37_11257 [Neorhizobium alkalisoli]